MKKGFLIFLTTVIALEVVSCTVLYLFVGGDDFVKTEADYYQRVQSKFTWFDRGYEYHPFLGYYGLKMKQDLEDINPNAFRVGILGGSMAEMFAGYFRLPEGKKELEGWVKSEGFDRPIQIVNLAGGGYRQPHQAITTVLYRDRADLFLSIEGFNEIDSRKMPCKPFFWPFQSMRFSPDGDTFPPLLINFWKGTILLTTFLADHGVPSLRLFFYVFENQPFRWAQRLSQYRVDGFRNCPSSEQSDHASKDSVINYWMEQLKNHHRQFQGSEKSLYTFFQPNQFLPETKPWSENERAIFKRAGKAFQDHIEDRYGEAHKRFVAESANQPNWIDLAGIFSSVQEDVYVDECCHVGDRGNSLIFERLKPIIRREFENHK